MSGAVGLRAGGLGLLALLVTAITVTATRHATGSPKAVLALAAVHWYTAVAAPEPVRTGTRKSACGVTIRATTLGVAHPVLPCGVRIELELDGVRATAPVVDRGPTAPGREFDLTPALAEKIGLHGQGTIRWRFAG